MISDYPVQIRKVGQSVNQSCTYIRYVYQAYADIVTLPESPLSGRLVEKPKSEIFTIFWLPSNRMFSGCNQKKKKKKLEMYNFNRTKWKAKLFFLNLASVG